MKTRIAILLTITATATGCAKMNLGDAAKDGADSDYRTVKANPHRDTDRAKTWHEKAVSFFEENDFESAEHWLNKALIADVKFGPAHNNLGRIYFSQKKFYLAAWEFEYAIRLMPNSPEPYNNLGLVYENVGKFNDAVNYYESAWQLNPSDARLAGNLARAKYRRGDRDELLADLLDLILTTHPDLHWVRWARELREVEDVLPASSQVHWQEGEVIDSSEWIEHTDSKNLTVESSQETSPKKQLTPGVSPQKAHAPLPSSILHENKSSVPKPQRNSNKADAPSTEDSRSGYHGNPFLDAPTNGVQSNEVHLGEPTESLAPMPPDHLRPDRPSSRRIKSFPADETHSTEKNSRRSDIFPRMAPDPKSLKRLNQSTK